MIYEQNAIHRGFRIHLGNTQNDVNANSVVWVHTVTYDFLKAFAFDNRSIDVNLLSI